MDPGLLIGSAGAGAAVQIFKQLIHDQHDMAMRSMDLNIKANDAHAESADKAAKRGSGWGRRFALVVVLSVAFIGLLFAAWLGIPVAQIVEKEPVFNLFGLLKLGGGEKVVMAEGFVLPQYVKQSVQIIIAFYFGASAAKR